MSNNKGLLIVALLVVVAAPSLLSSKLHKPTQQQSDPKQQSEANGKTLDPKIDEHFEKFWLGNEKERKDEFDYNQKMLRGSAAQPICQSIWDLTVLPAHGDYVQVQVPVPPAKIVAIKGWVRERMPYPAYPWHPCPFSSQNPPLQCGQVPPTAPASPGGAWYLPYYVSTQLDGTALVRAPAQNASGTLERIFRLEVDYNPN